MSEEEILAEIAATTAAINRILGLGQEYELENSSSKRKTKDADIDRLKAHRADLYRELQQVRNQEGGLILSF